MRAASFLQEFDGLEEDVRRAIARHGLEAFGEGY